MDCVSFKVYDKRDDFDFDIVNFCMVTFLVVLLMVYTFRNLLGLLESAIMLRTSTPEINISRPNFSNRAIGIIKKKKKTFSKFYRRHYELISKYKIGLKTLLREILSEPEFYGDLVYKCKKLIGRNDFFFSVQKNHYTLQTYRL